MVNSKVIIKNIIALFSGNLLSRLISFGIIIYLAKELGTDGLGQYSFIFSILGIIFIFGDFGINTYLLRNWSRDKKNIKKEFNQAFNLKIILSLILFSVTFVYSFFDKSIIVATILAGLAFVLDIFRFMFSTYFSSYERMELKALMEFLERIISLVLIILLIKLGYGLNGVLVALVIARIIVTTTSALISQVPIKIEINFIKFKSLLKNSYKFFLIGIFLTLYFKIDSVMLKYMVGFESVGWYNASYNLIHAITFIPALIVFAIFPSFSYLSKNNDKGLNILFNKAFKYLTIIAIPLTTGVILIADKIILLIYGNEFFNSIITLQILIVAGGFIFVNYLFGNLLNASKREGIFMKIIGFSTGLNIIMNLILIPLFSFKGAAIATVLTELINFVLLYKYTPMKVRFKFLTKVIIATFIMAITIYLTKILALWYTITIATATYIIIILFTKVITIKEIRTMIKPKIN